MANRRMISKSICTSEQVNSLPLESQLLFTWMITHADDDGRMKGSAASVRGLVFPMKEFTVADVDLMLQEIQDVGLIYRWSDQNGTYIEFPKWKSHQKIQKDRYHASELPSYSETVNNVDPTCIQSGSNVDTQDNIVESRLGEKKENKNILREKESEGKPALTNSTPPIRSLGEHAAARAWQLLDGDKPDLLESRYLSVVRNGVPSGKILILAQDISKDDSLENKGKEFEKRIKALLPKNKISTEKE